MMTQIAVGRRLAATEIVSIDECWVFLKCLICTTKTVTPQFFVFLQC